MRKMFRGKQPEMEIEQSQGLANLQVFRDANAAGLDGAGAVAKGAGAQVATRSATDTGTYPVL